MGPVRGGVAGSSIYCVCHSSDEGFMVECSDGTGGCGGWFHPECCNLELSPEQRQKSECFLSLSLARRLVRLVLFCLVLSTCLLVCFCFAADGTLVGVATFCFSFPFQLRYEGM